MSPNGNEVQTAFNGPLLLYCSVSRTLVSQGELVPTQLMHVLLEAASVLLPLRCTALQHCGLVC